MKSLVKSLLLSLSPGIAGMLQIRWQRRHTRRLQQRLGLPQIAQAFIQQHGLQVSSGPFAGMQYVPLAVGSSYVPKLVGSYEAELQSVVSAVIRDDYRLIVDIGCAEGYYAVGLARSLPQSHVYAFDIDSLGRKLCAKMARANSVSDRITIAGECDAAQLEVLLQSEHKGLVICDCEGCEYALLRPEIIPALSGADLLVELHQERIPQQQESFLNSFRETHHLTLIDTAPRNPADYPALVFLSPEQQQLALNELRHGPQQWVFLQSKKAPSGSIRPLG